MTQISIVRKSQLEGAVRLDAEYYQPNFLMNAETLSGCPTLKEISRRITDFGAYSQFNFIEYVKDGVRFLRNQDIGDVLIYDDEPIYISQEAYNLLSLKLENGDLVLPRVGTLGKAAVITNDHLPCSANQNLAQVKLKKGINPFWVAVFLSTRYGLFQIFRYSTGNVQPWLNLGQIENLKVFLTSQKDIEDRVIESAMKSVELSKISKSLYSQAENLLLEELGLKDFKPKYQLSYSANLSKAFKAHRVDAEYFQPSYEDLVRKLSETVEVKPLKYFLLDIKRGIEVGGEQYQEEGKPFIRVSNISITGLIERDQKYLGKDLYEELAEHYQPKMGELLLTKDATPGIAHVLKEPVEGIIAGGILRLAVDEAKINSEYLALCINSLVGKLQIERDGGGSVIKHWKPEQIKRLCIPVLSGGTQKSIASLIRQSHEARRKAKQLLEEAKSEVENLIEGRA